MFKKVPWVFKWGFIVVQGGSVVVQRGFMVVQRGSMVVHGGFTVVQGDYIGLQLSSMSSKSVQWGSIFLEDGSHCCCNERGSRGKISRQIRVWRFHSSAAAPSWQSFVPPEISFTIIQWCKFVEHWSSTIIQCKLVEHCLLLEKRILVCWVLLVLGSRASLLSEK